MIVKSKYKERKDEIETWERETVEKLKAACEIADAERWRDERQGVRELKRWEAWDLRGWNEERNWKFRVLTLYIYEGNLVILYII